MTIVAPTLFLVAALAAVFTVWKSVAAAVPAIKSLRQQLAGETQGHMVHHEVLTTRDDRAEQSDAPVIRARRHPQPKPVTHRLHHYPHRAHAA